MRKTGAIFLDRDGVINQNRNDHVKSWEEFEFIPGALESIRTLTETGLPIFIVTNQAIVNRGAITPEQLESIHNRMIAEIERAGGKIARVYYCPHDNHEKCSCRKPEPGMLKRAEEEFGIDLSQSFLVGDAETDVQAGLAVGARSILVITGRGRNFFVKCWQLFRDDLCAACDLADATTLIKETLQGKHPFTTTRFRSAFHLGLYPQEPRIL